MRDSSLAEFERRFVHPTPGRTLIVGSKLYRDKEDRRKRYPNAVGVDMLEGDGVDLVLDLEEPLPDGIGCFDHVECMSVLEHSRRPWLMAENIQRLMTPGAFLFVSVPWIWRYHPYDHDYFRFSRDGIRALFPEIEWEALMYASERLSDGDKASSVKISGHPFLSRTETCGFGRKK